MIYFRSGYQVCMQYHLVLVSTGMFEGVFDSIWVCLRILTEMFTTACHILVLSP